MIILRLSIAALLGLSLTACAQQEEAQLAAAPPPAGDLAPVSGESDAEKADEVAPEPDASGSLGTTIASLGDPSRPGNWLETPLVDTPAQGRVSYEGKSVDVELIPIPGETGAGSRMSLGAFQALGAPITGLPEVEVFRN